MLTPRPRAVLPRPLFSSPAPRVHSAPRPGRNTAEDAEQARCGPASQGPAFPLGSDSCSIVSPEPGMKRHLPSCWARRGLLFLAERDVETCPSQRRHLILAEITYRPCNSWGKAVSKTVHMVVLITGAGLRVEPQRTCWLPCSGPHLSRCRQQGSSRH